MQLVEVGAGALIRQPSFVVHNDVYRVTQTQEFTSWVTSSTSINVYNSFQFTASNFDQWSSITAVFDQYRFDQVEVTLIPQNSQGYSETNAGLIAVVCDYTDAAALTSFAQALDYPTVQVTRWTDPIRVTFKPHVAVAAYSGTFTSYASEASPWIATTSSGVQHYGFKIAGLPTGAVNTYNGVVRINMSLRAFR